MVPGLPLATAEPAALAYLDLVVSRKDTPHFLIETCSTVQQGPFACTSVPPVFAVS